MFNFKLYKKLLIIMALVYVLSYLSFQAPLLNTLVFIALIAATALIAWKNLWWGVLILIGELMLSSQGHLFDIYIDEFRFSMRMGIFVVLLVIGAIKISKTKFQRPNEYQNLNIKFQKIIQEYKWYILLAVCIMWGIVNGLVQGNNLNFIYQDANGYLFFLLLPVFIFAFNKKFAEKNTQYFLATLAAGITMQFILTLSLFFLYSHLDTFWQSLIPLYTWFRDLRLIEVGQFYEEFYRVFMQSGIWVVYGFFVFLSVWLFKKNKTQKNTHFIYILLVFSITILIISLSRSFWLATALTFGIFIIYYIMHLERNIRTLGKRFLTLGALTLISVGLISITLLIPIGIIPGLGNLSALTDRATQTDEAALSSRWDLLPALWSEIRTAPLLGAGYGATVTYKSSDPRYLDAHPDNPYYTTFAFEWGWLDLWYEIGLIGMIIYAILLDRIIRKGLHTKDPLTQGLAFGLVALAIIHFFTPFLNHPLGIGYILLTHIYVQNFHSSRRV